MSDLLTNAAPTDFEPWRQSRTAAIYHDLGTAIICSEEPHRITRCKRIISVSVLEAMPAVPIGKASPCFRCTEVRLARERRAIEGAIREIHAARQKDFASWEIHAARQKDFASWESLRGFADGIIIGGGEIANVSWNGARSQSYNGDKNQGRVAYFTKDQVALFADEEKEARAELVTRTRDAG